MLPLLMDTWTILPGQLYQSGCPDRPLDDFDIEVDMAGCPGKGAGTQIRNAIPDGELPSPDIDLNELEALVSNLCDALLDGRKVLVHCGAGINRSSLVTALVVRRLFGLSGADATLYIRSRRGPEALSNPWFASYLGSLGPCEAQKRA